MGQTESQVSKRGELGFVALSDGNFMPLLRDDLKTPKGIDEIIRKGIGARSTVLWQILDLSEDDVVNLMTAVVFNTTMTEQEARALLETEKD